VAFHSKALAWFAVMATGALCVSTAVAAKKPPRATLEALVISVDGAKLVLDSADEKHFTRIVLATSGKTEITIDGKPGKLSDLKEGQHVIVSPVKGTPTLVEGKKPHSGKLPDSGLLEGRLAEVSSAQVLLFTPLENGDIAVVKVPVGNKTIVVVDGKETAASNLKAGQDVMVACAGGTVRRIVVQPARAAN
jgi:hypothetical protein